MRWLHGRTGDKELSYMRSGGVAGHIAYEIAMRLNIGYYVVAATGACVSFRPDSDFIIHIGFNGDYIVLDIGTFRRLEIDIRDPEFDLDILAIYVFLLYIECVWPNI